MFLLDTDTIIYALKGHQAVQMNLKLHINDPMMISVISQMELYYGAYKSKKITSNIAKLKALEKVFDVLPVEMANAAIFGRLKPDLEGKGSRLDDFDLIIATSALTHNLTLVTNNEKHFKRIEGLKLTNWAQQP